MIDFTVEKPDRLLVRGYSQPGRIRIIHLRPAHRLRFINDRLQVLDQAVVRSVTTGINSSFTIAVTCTFPVLLGGGQQSRGMLSR